MVCVSNCCLLLGCGACFRGTPLQLLLSVFSCLVLVMVLVACLQLLLGVSYLVGGGGGLNGMCLQLLSIFIC